MLTDSAIRAAKPKTNQTVKLSDGGGLQLWIQPSGSKLWNLAYRFAGRQRKLAIGSYPGVGLKEARAKREEAKKLLASGFDPSQQKRLVKLASESQKADTFEAISREVLEKKRREGKSETTVSKAEWLFDLATPALGSRPIAEITAPEVLAVLRQVETRGRLETARRLRAIIGQAFRFAVATGRALNDPTGALRGALTAPVVQHRAAIVEPVPFGALLRAIDGYDGTLEVRSALQLLALTFTRPGELRLATWKEFELDAGIWIIPANRMKMRRPHRVPLSPQAIAILKELRTLTGQYELLFPGVRSPARPLSENTLNAALRRLGYAKDDMSSHGFRAAASSLLNECGKWNADAIEAQLAHVEANAVRKAYARAEYWAERVEMMAYWADRLDELRRGGIVVPLRA
ncbi:MAG: Prophage CP4-57 integrase [Beijerinckiaceae bacterium]|jgi:integrase|nr:MAG: Prophage CP4-57 integrase [Beijerinckiaceae bacterium]